MRINTMWFRDTFAPIVQALECSDATALTVLRLTLDAYQRGDQGLPFSDKIDGADEYNDGHAIKADFAATFTGVFHGTPDHDEVAELVYDAWKEGIQQKDRVTVRLVDCNDAVCECGACVSRHDEGPCTECGSLLRDYRCMAEVHDDYAHLWADSDQTIDGSSWECASDMPGFAYTILSSRRGLADELREEGYTVDESEYTEPEEAIEPDRAVNDQ